MSSIRDIRTPWRDKLHPAQFRGRTFFVETGTRAGGRRIALHEYPKRSVPYAEDMGRAARRFTVTGYLIGPRYLDAKDMLIEALEADGPAMLRMPFPIFGGSGGDMKVMAGPYQITESRERGGMCGLEMDFFEYGDPKYRVTQTTPGTVNNAATNLENTEGGYGPTGVSGADNNPANWPMETGVSGAETAPYTDIFAGGGGQFGGYGQTGNWFAGGGGRFGGSGQTGSW